MVRLIGDSEGHFYVKFCFSVFMEVHDGFDCNMMELAAWE